jgi:hypothetical protein
LLIFAALVTGRRSGVRGVSGPASSTSMTPIRRLLARPGAAAKTIGLVALQ